MTPLFQRMAVLGLGLLGGSLAAAARERRVAGCVVGATRNPDVLESALRRGFVDETGTFESAVRDAELVVLATPLFAMPEVVRRAAPELAPGALVTDVGSVKTALVETLPGLLPPGAVYVGAHPMAGGHCSGLAHARADLFEGAPCIVAEEAEPAARERVCSFWRALGARVVMRSAAAHDGEVAWMSHLPHLLAFAFAAALERAPSGAFELAGPGFRDFTRIARSEPELWTDILSANRKALAGPLQAVSEVLAGLSRAVEANDSDALERRLSAARTALSRGDARGSGDSN